VVDVSVRDDDLLYLQMMLLDEREDLVKAVSGVDDDRFTARLIADHRTIALQGPDWKDLVNHEDILVDTAVPLAVATMEARKKPSRGESFRCRQSYFAGAGCAGGCAGAAGCDVVCDPFMFDKTDPEVVAALRRTAKIESVMEVSINSTADHVVALERAVAAPRGPKAVWLPMPPKAAAMSPLLPLCSSTTIIRKKHTRMCTA